MKPGYRRIRPDELAEIGDPVVVATFMRSGTHLTIDLLRRQFRAFESSKRPLEPLDSLYLPVDVLLPGWEPPDWSTDRVLEVLRRPRRPVLKTHFLDPGLTNLRETQPVLADWLASRAVFLHVTRDLRRVIPSLWAFLQDWRPQESAPFDETFARHWIGQALEHRQAWAARDDSRSLDYGQLTGDPMDSLRRLGEWLQEPPLLRHPLLPRPLKSRWQSRFLRLCACGSESTAILASRETPVWNPAWDSLLPPPCPRESSS
jgi:hypothetical protein